MKRFIKNTKGAVTVFVTVLLIPAILISGTAVDLARIYTAQSILQDANQLAANTVLTQYDALLYDLYGVFGIAKNDPILARLLDEYISITVFGEDSKDTGLGTFQLFYGSNLSFDGVEFINGKHLRDPDVLRRQIEEYMKFRAPIIIVKELLELLDENTFGEDAGIVEDKLKIDEDIAAMFEKYKDLYAAIEEADMCARTPSLAAGAVGSVSNYLQNNILAEFHNLKNCMEEWESEEDTDKRDDLAAKYEGILKNIEVWIKGGSTGKNWSDGKWRGTGSAQGLYRTIENALGNADRFKSEFDDVIKLAKEIDLMRDNLSRKVDELESRLNDAKCSRELYEALTSEDKDNDNKTAIEMYREILKWDNVGDMAEVYKEGGYSYIDGPVKDLISGVKLRNRHNTSDPSLTQSEMEKASTLSSLTLKEGNGIVTKLAYTGTKAATYEMPDGFLKFEEYPGDNSIFFNELKKLTKQDDLLPVTLYDEQDEADADGKNSKEKQESLIDNLMDLVDAAYAGLTNSPLGAKHIEGHSTGEDALDEESISQYAARMSGNPIGEVITNPVSALKKTGDYLLLLTYATSMFSNYTTCRPETNRKTMEDDEIADIEFPISITGRPISPRVNYFFQSEWEYLYNGSMDAGKNLSAVTRLIYLVRMICNYITVFSVTEIKTVVGVIRTSFMWSPPLGFFLGELARAAFVAAESAVDVATLRAGHKVPLIKKASDWICSPKGLAKALKELTSEVIQDDGDDKDKQKGEGLSYSNYLMFFFVAKGFSGEIASIELVWRTADLMEWNIINYRGGFNCDEDMMANAITAPDRFRMEDMKTDFDITTRADMRMLFLSMLFAQNFSDSRGIGMPKTIPVTATDHRGY